MSIGLQIMKNVRSGIKGSKSTPIVIASKEDFEFCASFLKRGNIKVCRFSIFLASITFD